MTDLRVALVGYGTAGSVFHAPVIDAVPGLKVTGVVVRNPERAAAAAAAMPGVQLLGSAEDIWAAAERFDTVVVATPNRTHVDLARASIEAGLPVVVDKPLATSSSEAEELIALAEKRGVLLTTYQNRRWDSDLLTLASLLADGALGTVHRFESRFERWRPVPKPGWRESGDPADAGGLLNDLGSHLVDQALHLFGPVAEVYAEVDVRRAAVAVDDDVFVALKHASGVRSHLWASALAADLGPRFRVLGSTAAYVVHGLDGQEAALRAGRTPADVEWGAVAPESWGRLGADGSVQPVSGRAGAWQTFYAKWRDALRGEGVVPVEPRDALATLRVLEAARASAAESRVVSLPG